ncbi:MAG TPA: hypothetical protein VHY35_15125 [Stellaceae bacterium]|jgi:hypothetical protein|nr:hypothetical protein [Stellaceae bacterium]
MSVSLRHPRTGEIKVMQEGWSWGCCLGSGILGLPLFQRGLQVWGAAMVVFNIVLLVVDLVPTSRAATLDLWLSLIGAGLCVFFGFRANQMAIDRYLSLGWERADARHKFF